MKNKPIIIIAIWLLALAGGFLIGYRTNQTKDEKVKETTEGKLELLNTFYLKSNQELKLNKQGYKILAVIHTKKEYDKFVDKYELTNLDISNTENRFNKNYTSIMVGINIDECSEDIEPQKYKTKDGKIVLYFDNILGCGVCATKTLIYEVGIKEDIELDDIASIKFNEKPTEHCYDMVAKKPLLYLYPEKTTNVKVTFAHPELLTTTYPKYENSWEVIAEPNGNLIANNKNYYGLYWEEKNYQKVNFNEGFYVTKENAISFLEEKLTVLGLTEREQNEFIMYWLPILEKNEQSLVYFELTDSLQKNNELKITPTPDSLLRVRIHIKKVNDKESIKEQKLPKFNRTGFTAVEWGGVLYE